MQGVHVLFDSVRRHASCHRFFYRLKVDKFCNFDDNAERNDICEQTLDRHGFVIKNQKILQVKLIKIPSAASQRVFSLKFAKKIAPTHRRGFFFVNVQINSAILLDSAKKINYNF